MVVVGTGVYQDTNEAYPLDKKTLSAVALRSILAGASHNAETSESIGWAWALMPALKKIHTNEEDLSLCIGHHLETVKASSMFTTLTMGTVLALEQQKADPETIRSVRTAMSASIDSLGTGLFRYLLIPFCAMACAALASEGNTLGAVLMVIIPAVISIVCRMILINTGYAKGVRAAESFMKHADALKHASRIAGVFMLGALSAVMTRAIGSAAEFGNADSSVGIMTLVSYVLPGLFGLLAVWFSYTLMAKKNKSPLFMVIVFIAIGLLGALIGIWTPYPSILNVPWLAS